MNDPASAQFAREAAQKSMVLLKNDGQLLPLDKIVARSIRRSR